MKMSYYRRMNIRGAAKALVFKVSSFDELFICSINFIEHFFSGCLFLLFPTFLQLRV